MNKIIKNLLFLDLAERFSLTAFITCITYFLSFALKKNETEASQTLSLFKMIYFFFPLVSSIIITFYQRISIKFSVGIIITYLLGHIILMHTKNYFLTCISIIAICAGLLKPLIISIGSMQFEKEEAEKKTVFFNYLYLMMNVGGFLAFLTVPTLAKTSIEKAFILSFLGLLIAFIIFLIPIKKYKNNSSFEDKFQNKKNVLNSTTEDAAKTFFQKIILYKERLFKSGLFYIFLILIPYCSIYDQVMTQMPIQGFRMNNNILSYKIESFHLQALEPILIIFFVPMLLKKIKNFSIYKKLLIGFILFFIGSMYSFYIEYQLINTQIHLLNQVFIIFLLVVSEIFLYPTFIQVTFGNSGKMSSIFGSLIFTIRAICNLLNFYIFKFFNNNILQHKIFIIIVSFLIILLLVAKQDKLNSIK